MIWIPLAYGFVFGSILLAYLFIKLQQSGKYILAPLLTLLVTITLTLISLQFIGGFEGIGYAVMALGMFFSSIIGTLILPFLIRKGRKMEGKKLDKRLLIILPLLFLVVLFTIFLW